MGGDYTMSMPMDIVMAQTKPKKVSTTRYYGLKLHKEKDSDIIEYLEQYPNKQGAIKVIIRRWMYYTRYKL